MAKEYVDLSNLAGGAIQEIFQEHFQEVLEDIVDPNKEAEASREITIKIKIVPQNDRKRVEIFPTVTVKLATHNKFSSVAYIGHDPDIGMVASEVGMNQPGLFDDVKIQDFTLGNPKEEEEERD